MNEQPRAAAIGFQRAFGNEETRAGTKGHFKYAFGPGLYYQPGLKGGARRARACKTPLVTVGNTDRDQRPLPERVVGCHGPLVPARDTPGTDGLDQSPVFY